MLQPAQSSLNEGSENSYPQLFDREGNLANQLTLLQKSEFKRRPYLNRLISRATLFRPLRHEPQNMFHTIPKTSLVEQLQAMNRHFYDLSRQVNPTHKSILDPILAALPEQAKPELKQLITYLLADSADFFNKSKTHPNDSQLTPRDQYRALTHYWTHLILIYLFDEHESKMASPCEAAYAYSYLYPYTDNILDQADQNDSAKLKLIKNIHAFGETGQRPDEYALNQSVRTQEDRIYDLIQTVMPPPHSPNPGLVDALKGINRAQSLSLKQVVPAEAELKSCYKLLRKRDKERLFDISIIKGAAALMPNAFICHNPLGIEEANFAITLGYLGQIINDIEGIVEDLAEKRFTTATLDYLKRGHIDYLVERLSNHIQNLKRAASRRFSRLNQRKIETILDVCQLRMLSTTAYAHQRSKSEAFPTGLLSKRGEAAITNYWGIDMSLIVRFAQLEYELFGGADFQGDRESSNDRETFSDPQQLRETLCKAKLEIENSLLAKLGAV